MAHLARQAIRPRAAMLLVGSIVLAAPAGAGAQGESTTICHATGDPTTPYQQVQASGPAVISHLDHPEDIVPAPAGGCPGPAPAAPAPVPGAPAPDATPTPTPAPTVTPDEVPPPQQQTARSQGKRRRTPASRPVPVTAPAVAADALAAPRSAARTIPASAGTLPLTGGGPPYIALVGLGFLMAGAGVRLRYAGS